ncbi:lysophospholipid acyltransferase family protein [Thermophilibacter gallinarum]|uniref:lysophospholipid acyltransferase family protein n=1 Tax=Thermophilibacter gallinarum TaxID=2779357 RepID=UPI001CF78F44|nr:lysophospholipid acyltransferase family protein [Thermophilibacter gallinarum]
MSEKDGRMRAFAGNTLDDYYDHDIRQHPLPGRLLIGAVVRILWVVTKFLWPWRVENIELLTEDPRGRVIIMNHESMLDPVVVVVALWLAHVPVRIVYKSDFDRIGPAAWLFSRAGGFPVQRGTADMKTVRRARAMLARGESVLIYPEGTRVRDDADAQTHGGYAIMAQLAKAPVQPVAIIGARRLRFRRPVYVRAERPIEWSEILGEKRKEQLAEMERRGMERVYALRDQMRADYPGVD